jgi:hypothetical protein
MVMGKHFTFSGIVESVRFNLTTTAVFLPHHIIADLPRGTRLKAIGIMNGAPFSLSLLYRKDSGKYFPISAALRRAANIEAGDAVNVTFRIIEPEKVELPPTHETVLCEDDKARKIWRKLTIRVQKVLDDYILAARNIDMRMRRALDNVKKARSGTALPHPTRRKKGT